MKEVNMENHSEILEALLSHVRSRLTRCKAHHTSVTMSRCWLIFVYLNISLFVSVTLQSFPFFRGSNWFRLKYSRLHHRDPTFLDLQPPSYGQARFTYFCMLIPIIFGNTFLTATSNVSI